MKYIQQVETVEELKKCYKKLAMQMHPDRGGNEEEMKILNNEYDTLFARLKHTHKNKEGQFYQKETEEQASEWRDIINQLLQLNMEQVQIEVIGSFLWLTGNTRPYKEELKALDFKWSRKKSSWYLSPKGYRKFSKKTFNMTDIRNMYGSETINNPSQEKRLLPQT